MKSIIDEEKLKNCLQRIELYKREEKIIIMNINHLYQDNKKNYQTSNTDNLLEKQEEIGNRLAVIERIHNQDTKIIVDTIEKYNELQAETEKRFDNIV